MNMLMFKKRQYNCLPKKTVSRDLVANMQRDIFLKDALEKSP